MNEKLGSSAKQPSMDLILKRLAFEDRVITVLAAGRSIAREYAPLDPHTLHEHDQLIANGGLIQGPATSGYQLEGETEYVMRLRGGI